MSASSNSHLSAKEFADFKAEAEICIRKTFIEVREPSPPPLLRSKTAPSICADTCDGCESPTKRLRTQKRIDATEESVQRCAPNSEAENTSQQSQLNADAEPFYPEGIAPPDRIEVRDLVSSPFNKEMRDLTTIVDSLVADAQGFNETLSAVIEEEVMPSEENTKTQDFMNQLVESLQGLCEPTPKENTFKLESDEIRSLKRKWTLEVPYNTPAALHSQDISPSHSDVVNQFAMERKVDVLCHA